MEVPVIVLRVYLGSVTSFWSTFVLGGGGGGNVTFHGNDNYFYFGFLIQHTWLSTDFYMLLHKELWAN